MRGAISGCLGVIQLLGGILMPYKACKGAQRAGKSGGVERKRDWERGREGAVGQVVTSTGAMRVRERVKCK